MADTQTFNRVVKDKKGVSLTLRPLAITDAQALYSFFQSFSEASKKSFQPHPFSYEFAKKMCQDFGSLSHLRLVAVTSQPSAAIIGYAFITRFPFHPARGYFGIGVSDAFQGRGISSLLMTELFEYARVQGTKYVYLNVLATNSRAQAAYTKQGFVPISPPPLISKLITLYELWYNGQLSDLLNPSARSSGEQNHAPVWMKKQLV